MNGTIKVLCYKSKTLKDGSNPLMVRVCKDGKKKYQSIGISILPSHCDFKRNKPSDGCPNKDVIKLLIQQRLCEIQKPILSKRIEGKDYTATTIIKTSSAQGNSTKSVVEYYLINRQCRYSSVALLCSNQNLPLSTARLRLNLPLPTKRPTTTWESTTMRMTAQRISRSNPSICQRSKLALLSKQLLLIRPTLRRYTNPQWWLNPY